MNLFRRLVFIVTVSFVLCGCKDWWPYDREGATKLAKGSIYKNLEDRGDYGLFLQALDITGYKKAVNESDLLTVFAPNDAAFKDYMTNVLGVSDLEDVLLYEDKMEELTKTVAYHIIQFSWSLEDFLGFTMSADPEAPRGDGSAYKYKTLAREAIGWYQDPLSRREVQLYHREKYLPVFSTNLFKNRMDANADIEAEYKRIYPDVNWIGSDNHLYVGDAAVIEQGIPADNGYLYTIDKVALPQPTIYDMLDPNGDASLYENHKIFARILQRMNRYTWDKSLSEQYALPGDSLFYHYTYVDPSDISVVLPQVASEWAYHDEYGSNVENSMSWAITALLPTDEVMTEWLNENLPNWFSDKNIEQAIDELPYNTLYHIAIAHLFGRRNLTIPYELFNNGVSGAYSEIFKPTEDDVIDIKMAANGIVYTVNEVNTPLVFQRFTRPLFTVNESGKSFQLFANAFSNRDLYMTASAATELTPYTLFVVSDNNLQNQEGSGAQCYMTSPNSSNPMKMDIFRKNNTASAYPTSAMSVIDVSNFMMAHLAYGYIPAPQEQSEEDVQEERHILRYYKMQKQTQNGSGLYIYALDGEFYDELENKLGYSDIRNVYDEDDGVQYGIVYELREAIRGVSNGANVNVAIKELSNAAWKPGNRMAQLMKDCGILNNDLYFTDGWNTQKDMMIFLPSNEAIEEAEAQGQGTVIPYYDPDDDSVDAEIQELRKAELKRWCQFYIIDRYQNAIDQYALPGLDPYTGPTENGYEYVFRTAYDYESFDQALYCKVGWDPSDSFRMYLEDKEGNRAHTLTHWPLDPNATDPTRKLLMPNRKGETAMVFVIDHCFPASAMTPGPYEEEL